jgi:hypothetical protein
MALFRNVITKIPKLTGFRIYRQPIIRTYRTVISVDTEKFKNELDNIKLQKGVSVFAWGFYPALQYVTDSFLPFGLYSGVCSSVHFIYARSIIQQVGNKYYKPEYMGMKYWINWDDELIIESPKWTNLYWPKYPSGGLSVQENIIKFIDQTKEEKELTTGILAQRKYRFWFVMGNVINYSLVKVFNILSIKHISKYMSYELFPSISTYDCIPIAVFSLGYYLIVPYINVNLINIDSSKYQYYYVNMFADIILTNNINGFRDRMSTIYTSPPN